MDSAPSLEASNVALQRLLVQQPVQQRRRKTVNVGGTQRTPDPGMKHAEDASEHWRTRSSVSRMRYSNPLPRLKQGEKRLEPFRFWIIPAKCSNRVATRLLHLCFTPCLISAASSCLMAS
jgi:hypothetical protein